MLIGQLFLSGNVIVVACGHNTWIFYYIFKYVILFLIMQRRGHDFLMLFGVFSNDVSMPLKSSL